MVSVLVSLNSLPVLPHVAQERLGLDAILYKGSSVTILISVQTLVVL